MGKGHAAQTQCKAQPPENDEKDEIRRILQEVKGNELLARLKALSRRFRPADELIGEPCAEAVGQS